MNPTRKSIITGTALLYFAAGMLCLFLPEEISRSLKGSTNQLQTMLFQLLSALYLGFGVLNWLSRDALIGGIYKRPVILANLIHFWVGTITLIRFAFEGPGTATGPLAAAALYTLLTLVFFVILRSNPKEVKQD